MQNDWILDVLADLRNFATANGYHALAEQLDDTMLIAAAEIASRHLEETGKGAEAGGESGPGSGGHPRRHSA